MSCAVMQLMNCKSVKGHVRGQKLVWGFRLIFGTKKSERFKKHVFSVWF